MRDDGIREGSSLRLTVGDTIAKAGPPDFEVSDVVSSDGKSELDRLGERLREASEACRVAATRRQVLEDALSSAQEAERAAWQRAAEARADVLEACGLPRPEMYVGGTVGMRVQHAH